MGKPKKKCKRGAPEYMTTYGDMVTLLLTFFVLMFSSGEAEPIEMRLILSAFKGSLGMFTGGNTLSKGSMVEMGMSVESLPSRQKGSSLARSKREAMEILKPELRAKRVRIMEDERGITISLSADAYFKPGEAQLQLTKSSELLRKIGDLIARVPNRIRIEGHTDNTKVDPRSRYKTNWELSTARAMSVLSYLSKNGANQGKLELVGYSQYRPIERNVTPEGRAYNRRVDIVIIR